MKRIFFLLFAVVALGFVACDPIGDDYYYVINNSGRDLMLEVSEPASRHDSLWHIAYGDTGYIGVYYGMGGSYVYPCLVLGHDSVRIVFDDSTTLSYPFVSHDSVAPDDRNIHLAANWTVCPRRTKIGYGIIVADDYYTITEDDYRRAKEESR